MKYIESPWTDPYYNLALEEEVFEQLDRSQDWLMLWQNHNTIVIGKYQNTIEEINTEYVAEQNISVARRLSGGGAVYHDKGNLNYTLIVDQDETFDFNFRYFVLPVTEALKTFGIEAEFSGRNDVTIGGRKFSGNSQYIKKQRILHHGCIMLDSNLNHVEQALRVKDIKVESKSTKSVRSRVTTINEHAETPIAMEAFKEELKGQVAEGTVLEAYELTEEDVAAIEKLRNEKYITWEWNYGFSPAYTARRAKKFPGGVVEAHINVEKGEIRDLKFFGDFFGNGDIGELEAALRGQLLNEGLLEVLEQLEINEYMNGIGPAELFQLLTE
ncbi:MAG: lipoate--protein ligase [Firmicutes bacterium]|nr:lipoate--protein ligase [Bacillota bacterium]